MNIFCKNKKINFPFPFINYDGSIKCKQKPIRNLSVATELDSGFKVNICETTVIFPTYIIGVQNTKLNPNTIHPFRHPPLCSSNG